MNTRLDIAEVTRILDRIGRTPDRLIPLLQAIQEQYKYLPEEALRHLCDNSDISPAAVESVASFFGQFRRSLPQGVPYGLEVRNPQYLNRAYFQFLEAFDLVPVLVQGYWMPDIRDLYAEWRESLWAHPTVVIRLMGPDRQAIEALAPEGWNRVILPKDDELPGIASLVQELLDRDVDVYVNVNNHYEGSSPLTVEKLEALLGTQPTG